MKAGWEEKLLGEAFQTVTGKTPPKKEKSYYSGTTPLIKPPELLDGPIGESVDSLTDEGAAVARVAPAGSVLVSCIGNLGKIGIAENPVAFNQQINAIYPNSQVAIPEFTFYQTFAPHFRGQLNALAAGTTVSIVNKSRFNSIRVMLPPLEEQQRIVAVLDEAFEGLARARAHAEANLQNARELFESYLREQFLEGAIGTRSCAVGDILTLQRGFDITKKDQRDGTVPVVSSGGAKSFHAESKAQGPGIVVGRKGSIGSVYYIEEDYWPHDTTLWVKDFKANNPRLVYYLLKGLRLSDLDTGSANPSLNRNLVHPLMVNWPDDADQIEIAARIRSIELVSVEMQSAYESKLQDIDDLHQSLLQKAFAGELT